MKGNETINIVKRIIPYIILGLSCLLMLYNTFAHLPEYSYDYYVHLQNIQANQDILKIIPESVGNMDYNPPLYYYIFGKISGFVNVIMKQSINPYYVFRIFHIIFILVIAFLYMNYFLPLFTKDLRIKLLLIISLFLLPNLYLSQVMVRADHLLFLFLQLLFYFWFCYDFQNQLAVSWWRQFVWAVCLIGMANSRNFAFPAFLVFFLWGCIILYKQILISKRIKSFTIFRYLVLVFIIIGLSGGFYFYRFYKTRLLFDVTPKEWTRNYTKLAEGYDRKSTFFNLEFFKVIETPNKTVKFGRVPDRIQAVYFHKFIERKLTPEAIRIFNKHYRIDQSSKCYLLKNRNDTAEIYDVLKISLNNSFFPRLYGDMWADHWLYFSGVKWEDLKVDWKRIVLILAIPFSLGYFLIGLISAIKAIWKFFTRNAISYQDAAGLLFFGSLIAMMLFIYKYPNVGMNGDVKFIYLFAYQWFPIICFIEYFRKYPKIINWALVYTCCLFMTCLPLDVFWS